VRLGEVVGGKMERALCILVPQDSFLAAGWDTRV